MPSRLVNVLIIVALAVVLGIPLALRPGKARSEGDMPRVIIITPHVQQISYEFGAAFTRWHQRVYGAPAGVDWRGPLGTSEIITLLKSQYSAAAERGDIAADGSMKPGTIGFDIMFGGGSYDHTRLIKDGPTIADASKPDVDGKPARKTVAMSIPTGFTQAQLDAWFGPNLIGNQPLYESKQHWIGTALSGFGIVYNREVLARLGVPEPDSFDDLADPRLIGWIALADPRQSGSITTTFDAIMNYYGWERGWRLLREMCANTRYFTNSSTKPPIDVSQGEAAAGLAIDFYGRSQAQAIIPPGADPSTSRVGYVDPQGAAYIDADPVSILRGGPNPELAKHFVEFCLSDEAQALWQFPARASAAGAANPKGADGLAMGPDRYSLRRMPVRREMYAKYGAFFIDKADPFGAASQTKSRGWRSAIGLMMGAFAIDVSETQREAWRTLVRARAAVAERAMPAEVLAQMEDAFYSWPTTPTPEGTVLEFTEANFAAISALWKDPKNPEFLARCRIEYTRHFDRAYRRVIELGRSSM